MRAVDVIARKRDGNELTGGEIAYFVRGISDGSIPDYQVSAWAMAVLLRGMTIRETTVLALALADSGERMDLSSVAPNAVDKHSTGGVGDKTTFVVAPIAAACGVPVAKLSGRGLGASGGTIDKLESIPGFRTMLTREEFASQLRRIGIALCSQTAELAPADGRLYALRDVTGTVPSLPLIAASVMSKKIAAGARAVVLDVKAGNGAFMPDPGSAAQLARWMARIGRQAGLRITALVSDMNQPLGCAVGNALEVKEALAVLRGGGPPDLRAHCLVVAAHMLRLGGKATTLGQARGLAEEVLRSGRALEKFGDLLEAQGADRSLCAEDFMMPAAPVVEMLHAGRSGHLAMAHAGKIGEAAVHLGAGRLKKGDAIEPAAGLIVRAKVGDRVRKGDALCEIHAATHEAARRAEADIQEAFRITGKPSKRLPLFYATIR